MEFGQLSTNKRVCVIGGGAAGLCALKHALSNGMDVTAYEQSKEIGGTWVYSENTKAECEDDIHTSMYQGLRTNLPKEVMSYPDFPYPDTIHESFIRSAQVLEYLSNYAEHFHLIPHIKLEHEVIRVRPLFGEWEIYVHNRQTNEYEIHFYDFVFVCNGHYSHQFYPELMNMDIFEGIKMHSHLYRKPDMFKDKRVLVIGGGPSGLDICNQIRTVAKFVFLSHHLISSPNLDFMANVQQKGDVQKFTETTVLFKDFTEESIDAIIFCTGYKYGFSFISTACEIRAIDNYVYPLYKHIININYPSMAFIGIPFIVSPNQLFDLQVRFCMKFYTHQKKLPTHDEMRTDCKREMKERWASGLPKKHAHVMGYRQYDYYKELSEIADIKNLKPVIIKIMRDCSNRYIYELETYRNEHFRIIDDDTFVKNCLNEHEM